MRSGLLPAAVLPAIERDIERWQQLLLPVAEDPLGADVPIREERVIRTIASGATASDLAPLQEGATSA